MSKTEGEVAKLRSRAREFNEYLSKRIEDWTQRLTESEGNTRALIKTERAEATVIQIEFKKRFAGWL